MIIKFKFIYKIDDHDFSGTLISHLTPLSLLPWCLYMTQSPGSNEIKNCENSLSLCSRAHPFFDRSWE